jgi:hypothetical protein
MSTGAQEQNGEQIVNKRANKLSMKRLTNRPLAAQGNNNARAKDLLPVNVQPKQS